MFQGKWALVTGAGSGIGRAFAEILAERGARLVLVDQNEDALAEVAAELSLENATVLTRRVDVGSRDEMVALGEWVHERILTLDLLVNNAGVIELGGALDTSWDAWERLLRVNVWGVIHGVKVFVPAMRERKRGAVINVASASGIVGLPTIAAYSTSKFAVVGLSTTLHGELLPHGVHVTCVCPGLVHTNLGQQPHWSQTERDEIDGLLSQQGLDPHAVARAALDGVKKNQTFVHVGGAARLIGWAARLIPASAPRWSERLTRPKAK